MTTRIYDSGLGVESNKVSRIGESQINYIDLIPNELILELLSILAKSSKKKIDIFARCSTNINKILRIYQARFYDLVDWNEDKYIQNIVKCKCCLESMYFASLSLNDYYI